MGNPEQLTKAEPKREGFFVEEVKNEKVRVQELQKRLHDLEAILEPYSLQPPTENEGQTGQEQETDMDNALYWLRKEIDKTEEMINRIIDNFNG